MSKLHSNKKKRDNKLLAHILYTSIITIREHERTVPGIRFAKMVIYIQRQLEKSGLKIHLPRRWYLYGEVPEIADTSCAHNIEITNPDDELYSNVRWIGSPPKEKYDDETYERVRELAKVFEDKYGDEMYMSDMLREHYKKAPLKFQNSMLEFWLLVNDINNYRFPDEPEKILSVFQDVINNYNRAAVEIEPRLESIFTRFCFIEKYRLLNRQAGDLVELREIHHDIWEFWKRYCLFLSIKKSNDISKYKMKGYKFRAERELSPYLSAVPKILSARYEQYIQNQALDTMLCSEDVLKREWNTPEEAEAWKDL